MNTRWFSLRRRLLTLLLGGITAAWLATSIWVYVGIHHELDDLLEDRPAHSEESAEEHKELIRDVARRLLAPMLFGLPLLGLWIWLATWRALKPLDDVAKQITTREPERLQPLAPASAPREIRPLVEAINDLFTRVERTLESERHFTADAAHELRTPLAALATQAQVVQRARNAEERDHAVGQLITSTRRAGRLIDQLLTLARIDPGKAPVGDPVALDRLAEEVCADHGAQAMAKNISLELNALPAMVAGNADMLRILLRNLLDNAIRYTPPAGQVLVKVAPGILAVSDTGPGIPASERQRVFDRFHRLAGQDTEGSGLGLSIVARIAERHGASVELGTGENGKGLRVTVRFSARPVPAGAS